MMESISETTWDVVICGTGLQQSLLSLSLSRSDKKILHVDPNDYYGGAEAAFSLQEADKWAAKSSGTDSTSLFTSATVSRPVDSGLSASRAYSIALAPHIILSRSDLLSQLVSSRAFRQLEFLAVGSYFVFKPAADAASKPSLTRIPSTREDLVFSTSSIPARGKRQLMKFLKFVAEYDSEEQAQIWQQHENDGLVDFMKDKFGLDNELQTYVLTLTLSLRGNMSVKDGLAMLNKHLTSMGVFGAGFAAVYPKYGGTSEIAQVGCRAGAVGGAMYMLDAGIDQVGLPENEDDNIRVKLTSGDWVTTKTLVRGTNEAPASSPRVSRLVAVVGSPLPPLFQVAMEGAPTPAVAVVAFPPGSLTLDNGSHTESFVFVLAHSSDTGECPAGQSILYLATLASERSKTILEKSLGSLLAAISEDNTPPSLYQLYYEQAAAPNNITSTKRTFDFPAPEPGLAFSDAALGPVKEAWKLVMGSGAVAEDDYMKFEDREGVGDDDEGVQS